MKKNDKFIGKCVAYNKEGSGIVKYDNIVFFVPGMIKDEVAEILCVKMLKSYGYGKIIKLIETSKNRVEPRCEVYKKCGGCHLMHMNKIEQQAFKTNVVKDCFRSQTKLFECSILYFVDRISDTVRHANGEYLTLWKKLNDCLAVRDLPFSNFSVVRDFSVAIPENSILHLSILNATRLMQFFDLSESITVYSNANSFGIDGCLPTFLGQAYAFDGPAFIVIGDLAFFYAMNAMGIKHIKNNVHVLLINNGGGAEFHIVPSHNELATIDLHIGASHHQNAEGWIKSLGFEYIAANNREDFKTKLKQFVDTRDKPIVLEVFTDLETDGQTVLETYRDLEKQLGEIK